MGNEPKESGIGAVTNIAAKLLITSNLIEVALFH